jgi:hypothetical protein
VLSHTVSSCCPARPPCRITAGTTHVFADRLQFLRVHVLPYPLHIVPICDYAVLERVVDLEQPPILLRLWSDKHVTFQRSRHCPYMFWPADEGGEETFGHILPRESSSNRAAAVVEHNRCVVQSRTHYGGMQGVIRIIYRGDEVVEGMEP